MPPTLDPERWRQLEPILDEALDLPPGDRSAFLERVCGDDAELRRLAEQWLIECETSDGFLEEAGGAYLERVIEASPFDPSALARVGSRLGAFRLLSVLGQGGMGTVFLAERADGQFEQQVAIKVVHHQGLGEDARERFRFERQILARLEHPNIARLLDGGVDADGAPYLVMEYVDGVPLDEYCDARGLSLEQRLLLVADVCRVVAYAHRRQVVHRDLKPSNILVNRAGEVKLLDFGVAELLDGKAKEVSRGGSGYRLTLGFAAPEVLRGETATSASDLYSLGVLLFQILTGELPFSLQDRTFDELVETVSNSQPPPLAALPNGAIIRPKLRRRELEAVVHQALAKDPGRRQSSADAMADELQRLVEGEPVQALPQSLAYLLRKRFQQHRGSWLFAVVAALLLVFLAGGWFLTRRQTEQREEIARSFAQEAERIEWFLRYAQSLPLHDIRRERNLMKGRLERLEGQMEAFGPLAEGPGNFALGRGYAQLGDHERALESLETAWNGGFRTSGAALALGKVLGKLYAQRLEETLRLKDPQLRESRRRELQERYRNRALEFLRQSGSNELESPSYLSGLIAYYDDRLEEATRRAAQAQQEAPWLPDGFLLEGDAALALAIGHGEKGEYAEAEARFSQAFEAFGRAQEMTPSDPVPYESACEAWLHFIDMARLRGGDLTPGYSTGKRDCSLALEAEPDRPSCLLKIALLSIFRLQDPQLDPTEVETLLADAQRNAEAAKALLPSQGEVYQTLGTAHLSRALLVDVRQGLDPSPDLEQAAVAYRQAIRLDPALLTSHSNLGTVLAVSGGLLMNRGEDPRPLFDEAIGSYRQALARGPGRVALLNNLGNLHRDKAAYLIQRGLDPKAVLEAGLDACQEALAVNPRMVPALNLRGALEETLGQLAADRGEDPAPFFGRSIASLEAALGENPGYFRAAVNLGSTHLARARERAARGEDPRPALAEAFEALDLASQLGPPEDEEIFFNRLDALQLQAELEAAAGRPADAHLDRAERILRKGIAARPESSLLKLGQIQGLLLRAELLPSSGRTGSECLSEARSLAEDWLRRDVKDLSVRLLLVRIYAICASWKSTEDGRQLGASRARKLLGEVPSAPPLHTQERHLLTAVLDLLESSEGSTEHHAATRALDAAIGPDTLARRRWGHLLSSPTRAPA